MGIAVIGEPPTAAGAGPASAQPRALRIVVCGQFAEVTHSGPASNSRVAVAELIRRRGWLVQPDIDPTTSFVVLGKPPQVPPAPRPDDDAVTRDHYNRALAEATRWRRVHDYAVEHEVPIMNEVTFMHWLGRYPPADSQAAAKQ